MKLQVGVKVLLCNNKGQYLLIQRSKPLSDGDIKWDIPGGRINPDERLEDALGRELQEEIGTQLEGSATLLIAQDIIVPEANLHVVRLTYTAQLNTPVTLGDEHQDFCWVTREEALRLNIDPYLQQPLELLQ